MLHRDHLRYRKSHQPLQPHLSTLFRCFVCTGRVNNRYASEELIVTNQNISRQQTLVKLSRIDRSIISNFHKTRNSHFHRHIYLMMSRDEFTTLNINSPHKTSSWATNEFENVLANLHSILTKIPFNRSR